MIVYIGACLISIALIAILPKLQINGNRLSESNSLLIPFLLVLPLIIVASIRYNVGKDYIPYMNLYMRIANGTNTFPVEPLYDLLNRALSTIGAPFPSIFAVCAIIFCTFTMMAIRRDSQYPALSIFLFVTTGLYFTFFNLMRQLMAYSILLWAIKYAQERKLTRFLISVIFATGFHASSILFIIVYWLSRNLFNRKTIIVISALLFVMANPVAKLTNRIISMTSYAHYIGGVFDVERSGYIGLIINVVLVIFATIYYDESDEKAKLYYNLLVISLWLSAFVGKVVLIARIRYMFSLSFVISIPLFLSKVEDNKSRAVIKAAIVILYFIYFYYTIGVNNSNNVLPYDTIFNHGF